MAIVPITKIRIFAYRHDVAQMLEIAQKIGAIEFKKVEEIDGFLNEPNNSVGENNSKLARISEAITFLSNYEEKLGTFTQLKQGSTIIVSEPQLVDQLPNELDLDSILLTTKDLQSNLVNLSDKLESLTEAKNLLTPWQSLSVPLNSLTTKHTNTLLIRVKDKKGNRSQQNQILELLEESFRKANVEVYIEKVGEHLFALTTNITTDTSLVNQIVKSLGGENVQLPTGSSLVSDEIIRLNQSINDIGGEIVKIETEIKDFANKNLRKIKLAHDVSVWSHDREISFRKAKSTKYISVFEGWADKGALPKIEKKINEAKLLCNIKEVPLLDGEVPPVEIRNNSLIRPFEIITRLNGLPGHKDIDPTPFMAVFFFLFFGLCLTDVGYGALLMLVTLPFIFYFKVSKMAKQFSQLIFLMGLSTVIIGMFFGGYFGVSMSEMPKFLQDLQQFDPIGNPLPVFYLALSLGVIQVMVGMVLKIVSEAKNGQLLRGVLDQGPWLLLFTMLIVYGASTLGYLSLDSDRAMILIYLALILVVLASGRTGKTFFGKIQMSLLSVYNSINYLSDILSYSRLLALGLATSALAFAVNLIAGIVYEMIPYVGAILAVLVLIVGHVFTLVINTLGSFIHSARLQFVEFFGKFITGTGREFKPLDKRELYVSFLKEDSG